jgi:hypothetical protein
MQFNHKPPKSNGGGLFLKLKDGDRISVVFKGEPLVTYVHWVSGKYQTCSYDDSCEYCKKGIQQSARVRFNVVTAVNGAFVAKIFDAPWSVYEQLQKLSSDGWDIDTSRLIISREGELKETKWFINPAPGGAIQPDLLKQINSVKLHDLRPKSEQVEKLEPSEFEGFGDGLPS